MIAHCSLDSLSSSTLFIPILIIIFFGEDTLENNLELIARQSWVVVPPNPILNTLSLTKTSSNGVVIFFPVLQNSKNESPKNNVSTPL